MFARNFVFVLSFATVVAGAAVLWLKPCVESLTSSTPVRIVLHLALAVAAICAVYSANVLLILTLGRQELTARTEALWKERLSAAVGKRVTQKGYRDTLDHAARLQVWFHCITYRLRLWDWEVDRDETSENDRGRRS
jgi:hypothetical protein